VEKRLIGSGCRLGGEWGRSRDGLSLDKLLTTMGVLDGVEIVEGEKTVL